MPSHDFDDTLIEREDRESNYRTWSERAVVVGFNAESQSYDVVITTEKTLGDNLRTLNRVIRNVKSVLSTDVKTYFPGDSIVVGYVDDRREHPLIVGLGDSAGHTCIKVTLGIDTNLPVIEGPGAPSLVDPVFAPTPCNPNDFLMDSQTGSTTSVTVDCDSLDIDGCFRAEVVAPGGCGCGDYNWTGAGGLAGVTISRDDEFPSAIALTTTLASFGAGNRTLKICPPINVPSVPGTAWIGISHNLTEAPACVIADTFHNFHNCSDAFTGQSIFSGCETSECGTCGPPLCADGFSLECGVPLCPQNAEGIEFICDKRTSAQISSGCQPCILSVDSLVVTAEDACGRMISINVEIET